MDAVLPIAMRWLHIASVIVLLGGVFYARMVVGDMAMNFRPLAYTAIGGILVSGVYNFMTKASTRRTIKCGSASRCYSSCTCLQ